MDRRRLGMEGLIGLTIMTALMLAVSNLRPRAGAAVGEEPVAAGQPRNFSGKVTEKGTKKPIAGATVRLRRLRYPDPETGGRRVIQETTHRTDASGVYHFTIPPEQLAEPRFGIIFEVKHPDYPPEEEYGYDFSNLLRIAALGESMDSFDLELQHGEAVTGVVVTPNGKPAIGVPVHGSSYFAPEAKPGFLVAACTDLVRTDEQGRFRLVMVTPGKADLTFYPERFAVLSHRVKKNTRGDLGKFVLKEGIVIKGRVVDDKGTPMPDLIVKVTGFVEPPADIARPLLPGLDSDQDLSRTAITDASGEFSTAPMPPGTYRVCPVESNDHPVTGETFRQLPAPFAARKVTLEEGKVPEPVEIRALPHVVVEAHLRDSKGRPVRGWNFQLAGTRNSDDKLKPRRGLLELPEFPAEDDFWLGWSWPDAEGKIVWRVPRDLQDGQIPLVNFLTDERCVLRHRIGNDEPLKYAHNLTLGSLDHDVKGIEIVRYASPTVIVKVTARDGSTPSEIVVTARYPEGLISDLDSTIFEPEPNSDVRFTKQDDGRFRSAQLLPDQSVTIHAQAKGYHEQSVTLELPEGAVKELELVMDKP